MSIAIAATTPAKPVVVARMVDVTDMPGAGYFNIALGNQVGPTQGWKCLDDATAAVEALTDPDDVHAAAIVKSGGRFVAREVLYGYDNSLEPLDAWSDSDVCRTVAGKSLVSIIDGNQAPMMVDYKTFRHDLAYANAGSDE